MEDTPRSNPLSKREAQDRSADVAVCGTAVDGALDLGEIGESRVAFTAPLRSRSDLECLLRELCRHPGVRHLVLHGDDRDQLGEVLLDLWRDGTDADGRLPGSRGRLPLELDAPSLEALRKDLELWDWRGESVAGVTRAILELPARPPERQAANVPEPPPPERKVFLSRQTTFPIFANNAGDAWLQLLNLTLRVGAEKPTARGERVAEALNAIVTIGIPVRSEQGDVVDERDELPDFLELGPDDFDRYCARFTAPVLHAGDRGNRVDELCERLTRSPDSTAVFLAHEDLGGAGGEPGPISATFSRSGAELLGSFVLGSLDVYTRWPLEAVAWLRFQREVAARLDLDVGPATFVIHSARLGERDWARAQRVLADSFKRPLPLQVDPSGVFLFGNDGGKARGMLLDHDATTIYWEDAFSDPEDLSWYIVDVMPWLLPQHIRYVGQECAALMRAMREGECYEQG